MLKDCSSRRYTCKVGSVVGGVVILALTAVEKLTTFGTVLWMSAPLLLFWLTDIGYAAEQRRWAELLKMNPAKDDPATLLWEGGDAGFLGFFRELTSLCIWPFYVILFGLIAFSGKEITKANREVEAKAAEKAVPYYQQGNMSGVFPRSTIPPFNQNPGMQRFTPSPFGTPPRFMGTPRPVVTPPKLMVTPPVSPGSPPVKVQ